MSEYKLDDLQRENARLRAELETTKQLWIKQVGASRMEVYQQSQKLAAQAPVIAAAEAVRHAMKYLGIDDANDRIGELYTASQTYRDWCENEERLTGREP